MMHVERFESTDPADAAAELRALAPAGVSVSGTVSEIVASVRTRGEQALLEYAERFDGVDRSAARHAGASATPRWPRSTPPSGPGLEVAIANVRAVAEAGLAADSDVDAAPGPARHDPRRPGPARRDLHAGRAQPVPVDRRDGRRDREGGRASTRSSSARRARTR